MHSFTWRCQVFGANVSNASAGIVLSQMELLIKNSGFYLIVTQIFTYCDLDSILKSRQVCKDFANFLDQERILWSRLLRITQVIFWQLSIDIKLFLEFVSTLIEPFNENISNF